GLVTTARAYMSYRERQRQARIPDIFKPRKAMKPYEYPQFMDYADAIRQSYWLHTESNFTSDVQDFHTKVEPHERSAVQNSMLTTCITPSLRIRVPLYAPYSLIMKLAIQKYTMTYWRFSGSIRCLTVLTTLLRFMNVLSI